MKTKSKWLSLLFACVLGGSLCGCSPAQTAPSGDGDGSGTIQTPADDGIIAGANQVKPENYKLTQSETVNNISAVDAYGRHFGTVDSLTTKKKVGIFYFVWLGNNLTAAYDTSKMTNEELLNKLNTADSPGRQYYYGEPLYGYYNSADPWVIRKHIEQFIYAGLDYMCLDTTNGVEWGSEQDYRPTIKQILDILLEYREAGFTVPQVLFYTNSNSMANVQKLYDAFYDTENNAELKKYEPLWFNDADTGNANKKRKPWIVASDSYDSLPASVRDRFYKRSAQWPVPTWSYIADGFPWMDWTTTVNGARPQHNHNGMMSVSVAQHVAGNFSWSIKYNSFNYGRGYSQTDNKNDADRVNFGVNFQEQWDYAISQPDVNNIFVTGWNEWCAQMQSEGALVDCVTAEYSRDCEMMRGGYGDSFFIQLADNIRRFKGVSSPGSRRNPYATKIDLDGDDSQWEGTRGYLDLSKETEARNFRSNMVGVGNYTDDSGRNDILSVRTTYDNNNFYFRIECRDDITEYDGGVNWMNILVSVDGDGWEGYDYIINRSVEGNTGSVEKLKANGAGGKIGFANIKRSGKVLIVSVPRSVLGITSEKFRLEFKVADHVNAEKQFDIMEYYVSGDCAPCGRMNYTFEVR